jgi:RNA polymerase sigma factor (sigma-70 family)
MADEQFSLDLGNMQTQWSLIRKAHQASMVGESASAARNSLVMRYAPAIRHFVQVVVRDPTMADELSQDAMIRILKGDFAGADPNRGRFRDLLKTAIRNMARNHWAKEKRRSSADFDLSLLDDDGQEVQKLDAEWTSQWRENVLSNVWDKLLAWQESHETSVAHTVLKLRSEFPDASSTELAERLSKAMGRQYKPENTRQLLRRSRVKFVEVLVAEVADGLESPSSDDIREELVALGLYASVKDLLPTELKQFEQE